MCAALLYCRMFRLTWRDWAVRQKGSGPRCLVIAAKKEVKVGEKCTPGNLK